ncbi:50S ribosomal protein L17 [Aliifodinibius salipaludis]|uniref:Large ribosomal subunit protein bL17 n=1 Tax=Fodinibius salipaludis TaxID=2032627 RepID=A0A2A2G796_9BACT|nr:50S ribosomal protein L17 [Aliifodinibius salipaludis]
MRHLNKGRKLGRTPSHRKATLSALSVALIKEHRIVTTVPKAKELRTFVEPLITKAKEDTSHNRQQVFSKLEDKAVVSHLFDEVAQKAMDRPGGYTRVVKLGYRSGDNAQMAVIELVDYNDIQPADSKKKTSTRRAGKSKKTSSSADSDADVS